MKIISHVPENTDFIIPKKPCKTCGTRKRYKSNGMCVSCRRRNDAKRTGDRRSKRQKGEALLMASGMSIAGLSRHEKDMRIVQMFPDMRGYLRDAFGVVGL